MSSKLIAIVAGVGPGTGASVARTFGKSYPVVCLARTPESYNDIVKEINSNGGKAIGISTDVSDAKSIENASAEIKKEFGDDVAAAAAIFNASGRFYRKPFLELEESEFFSGLDVSGRGAFLFSRAFLPLLLKGAEDQKSQHPPTLIFTGATASVKSNAFMSSFSTGKFAKRALAASLAREFGPQGVHVAHAVIDGVIDIERTKGWLKDAGEDAKIAPQAIADSYWYLHTQPRSCFTWEIDIRPYVEKWTGFA
ncbi:NAD(P)-binding protein [Tothia fuscella]|uniref:NAD(P)-binding protein n=1 Tax=Tothia fuscella TaxID=1048955 RepID=A0A9P4NS06_9PEZI|nr:NAD(P)-binding protein [Tothia fuscella]